MALTLPQLFGAIPDYTVGVLTVDLNATGLETLTEPSPASLLAYLTLNAQAYQGEEVDRAIEITQATPLVLTRSGVQKTRYRFTVDFYGDAVELDPATL